MKSSVSKTAAAVSALGTPSVNSSVPMRVSTDSGAESDWTVASETCARTAGESARQSTSALENVNLVMGTVFLRGRIGRAQYRTARR